MVLDKVNDQTKLTIKQLSMDDLPEGEVTIRVAYSSVNYKDAAVTVFPYILRGVNWLGIDSVECPMKKRLNVWNRLGDDLKPTKLNEDMVNEISLNELPEVLAAILEGKLRGRTLVKL